MFSKATTVALLLLATSIPSSLQNTAKVAAAKFLMQSFELYQSDPVHTQQVHSHHVQEQSKPITPVEFFEVQYRCQYMSGLNFYDLKPLALVKDSYKFTKDVNDFYVSFCNDLPDDQSCSTKTMVTRYDIAGGNCQVLSGSDPTKDADFDPLEEDKDSGLKITYNSGNKKDGCSGEPSFQIQISCDKDVESTDDYTIDDSGCYPILKFSHKTGCKIGNLSGLWQWFTKNKWFMFVAFLIIGSILCFLGRTLFRPVLFIAGMILAISLVWIIFYSTFLNENTKPWVGWVVLVGALIFGLVIGCLMVKLVKLGAFILAAWGGYALGLLVYNAFLYKMNSNTGFWCFTVGMALVFGILALFFFDHILIHATALAGSFLVINGIGLVAGRYQNPFTIADEINNGVKDNIDPIFYAYLAGNLVLYVLGMLFQYRQKRGDKVNGKDPYSRLR